MRNPAAAGGRELGGAQRGHPRGAGGRPAEAPPRRRALSRRRPGAGARHLRVMLVHPPAVCRVVTRVADKFGHVRVGKVPCSVPIRHAYRGARVLRRASRVAAARAEAPRLGRGDGASRLAAGPAVAAGAGRARQHTREPERERVRIRPSCPTARERSDRRAKNLMC